MPTFSLSRAFRTASLVALAALGVAEGSINEPRGLYPFVNSPASYWPVQPAIQASNFTPAYTTSLMPDGGTATSMNVTALTNSQQLVVTNWAQGNSGAGVNGGGAATMTNRWTMVMDIRPSFGTGNWMSLLQTNPANNDDGEIFINSSGSLYVAGTIAPAGTVPTQGWSRLAFVCTNDDAGGTLTVKAYVNGVLVGSSTAQALNDHFSLGSTFSLLTDNDGESQPCLLGTFAYWTEPLSDAQIQAMGGAKSTTPEVQWAGMPATSALPGLTGKLKFGSFEMNLPGSGFALGSGVVQLTNAATVPGATNYYVNGSQAVRLAANGDLIYTGGVTYLSWTNSGDYRLNNVLVNTGGVTLQSTGATAGAYSVTLPVGVGVSNSMQSRRLRQVANIGAKQLGTGLVPLGASFFDLTPESFGFDASDTLYASMETMPLRYAVPELNWAPSTGAFQIPVTGTVSFDRVTERMTLKQWVAISGVTGDPRPSNDDYFAAATTASDTILDTNPDGQPRIRLMSQQFAGGAANAFTTHFPYGLQISWQTGGTSRLGYAASVRSTDSYLYEGLGTSISVARDCPDAGCALASQAGAKSFSFVPPDHWMFTRDGGLYAQVSLSGTSAARTVEWGSIDGSNFAHKIDTPFSNGSVLVAGQTLRATDVPGVALQDRPAALLLSGIGNGAVSPDTVTERPRSSGYLAGTADYPGLNLRLASDGAANATSRLAGTPLSYPLRARSKYSLRSSGVTGIHEAVAQAVPAGQNYPISTVLAGYAVGLTDVRLSFLSSENVESGISGAFNLPTPALLTDLAVKRLTFGCRGEMLSAEFDTFAPMTLAYWGCTMTPYAMHFALPDTPCADPAQSTMVLGAAVKLPALSDQPFNGNLGFKPNGHTVVPADNMVLANGEKVTSCLRPPSQMTIKGPGNKTYPFTPTGPGAYLNEYSGGTAPAGYVALTGEMDVPFFRNLRVFLNAKSSNGSTQASTLEVAASDSTNLNFYNGGDPDPSHMAKASTLPGPNARRSVWDLVELDLPLIWNTGLRRFEGSKVQDDLVVFQMEERCSSLGPDTAELNFGASVDPNAKVISTATLLNALGADIGGLMARLRFGLGNSTVIEDALGQLKLTDALVADTLEELCAPALDQTTLLDAAAGNLYNQLKARYETAGSQAYRTDLAATDTFFANAALAVEGQISTLPGGTWSEAIQGKLDQAIGVCDKLKTITSDPNKVLAMATAILNGAGSGSPNLNQVQATITELNSTVDDIRAQLVSLRNAFNAGGQLRTLMSNSLGNVTDIRVWAGSALLQLREDWVAEIDDPAGAFFLTNRQPEFTAAFKKTMVKAFLGSSTEQNLRLAINSAVSDGLFQLRNGFDGVIQCASQAAQSALALPDSPVTTLGDLGGVFGGAKMTGYARINGDSLNELRLDGELSMKVPDDLKLTAWLLIRDMDASLPGDACLLAGGVKTEVAVGASAPLAFIGQQATVNAEMRVGVGDNGPVSVAGCLGIEGTLNLQSIKVYNPQFGVAIGGPECYIYAKAAGELDAAAFAMSAEAAFFFGQTCRLDPLMKVNPNVAGLLTNLGVTTPTETSPIIGAYAYAYGDFSVLSLLGIPPSCLLDLRVGGGQGFYLFYRPNVATVGGIQMTYGVRGQALCLLDVSGRLDGYLAAAVDNNNVSLSGIRVAGRLVATLSGEIGIDPFSYDWEKSFSVDVIFNPAGAPKTSWDINY